MFSIKLTRLAVVACATVFVAGSAGSAFAETYWDASHPRRDEVNDRLRNQDHRINQERREGESAAAKPGNSIARIAISAMRSAAWLHATAVISLAPTSAC